MTFEQADAQLSHPRKAQLAALVKAGGALPDALSEAERAFCFGLYVYLEYEDGGALDAYLGAGR